MGARYLQSNNLSGTIPVDDQMYIMYRCTRHKSGVSQNTQHKDELHSGLRHLGRHGYASPSGGASFQACATSPVPYCSYRHVTTGSVASSAVASRHNESITALNTGATPR